ncbi:MAG: ATP-dependent DNA helicase RecG, partial [Candidatus Omnitrophota bacterium]
PYMRQYLQPQAELILYGKPEYYAGRLQMSNPEFEPVSDAARDESLNIGRIVPVYSVPSGMGQRSFRKLMKLALDTYSGRIEDFLPQDVRTGNDLCDLTQSITNIHFPGNGELQRAAYLRLAFEEFFLFQVPLMIRKSRQEYLPGISHKTSGPIVDAFIKGLPFDLTESQRQVISEIGVDMAANQAMRRLLQGDVGSGKTVVATIAALMAVQGSYQAAFMVPTEILARQHYDKIVSQIKCGVAPANDVRAELLTGSTRANDKKRIISSIARGGVDIVIGTHALLEEEVRFKDLGLVVIDEQHRFGVGQRALLPKKGKNPDVLIMTATPIPRTLAITIYGDLDISAIRALPPGRKPVATQWITEGKRGWLYDLIRQQAHSGRQVYVVYPLIEESFAMDLLSAERMYAEFKDKTFRDLRVGLVHGKLPQTEQNRIMGEFKSGEIQVLIATTVLEVGIDVANATVMVIEHADRFGLAQLHQLRGRIGRGAFASTCILVSDSRTDEAKARLEAMVASSDGFVIAEEDLKLRGPGEYFGSRQHGLTGLRIGNPLTQMHLLQKARKEAMRIVTADPHLRALTNQALKRRLVQRFPEYEKLMVVG